MNPLRAPKSVATALLADLGMGLGIAIVIVILLLCSGAEDQGFIYVDF
ncbi:MAG: hypothetical protein U0745_08970 [Polyangia bacterium]